MKWLVALWDDLFGRVETFYRVEVGGAWFICEPGDLCEFDLPNKAEAFPDGWAVTVADGDSYTVTPVRMARRQFNALPEFNGF